MKRVVIIGCGFTGMNAAKILANKDDIDVTLIDRNNYHLFQPLLYQVATAGLSPADITTPVRTLFSDCRNIRIVQDEAQAIRFGDRVVETVRNRFEYDYLILGCGARTTYYGNDHWEKKALGLKTIEQALDIRRRLLTAFERAETADHAEEKSRLLTFVIVGGGSTGVELAGAVAKLSRFTLSRDFKNIDPTHARIILIEAGARVLPGFSEKLSRIAARDLQSLGVEVRTRREITNIDAGGVSIGEHRIEAATIIWSAGIQAPEISGQLRSISGEAAPATIAPDLSLTRHPEVFVGGDQAGFLEPADRRFPAVAPVALQQGRFIAQTILGELRGAKRRPFHYIDKGHLATIGRKKAVLQIGRLQMSGAWAWLVWLFVHIYYLIGFKNKLFVFLQWIFSYVSFRKGARLIIDRY